MNESTEQREDVISREAHFIDYLLEQVEERLNNANWCQAEAVMVTDEQHRQMLTTVATWDHQKACEFMAESRARMLFLAVEYGVDIRPFRDDEIEDE